MSRTPLIFLSVFNVFEKVGSVFFENLVFHFKPSEASFSGVMCLASRLLENPKWLLENPKGPLASGGPAGRLAPGGPAIRFTKSINNDQKHARTHQEPPEPIQEAPEMLHHLAEQLFISFHNRKTAPTPRARPTHRRTVRTPEPRRQDHARRSH